MLWDSRIFWLPIYHSHSHIIEAVGTPGDLPATPSAAPACQGLATVQGLHLNPLQLPPLALHLLEVDDVKDILGGLSDGVVEANGVLIAV